MAWLAAARLNCCKLSAFDPKQTYQTCRCWLKPSCFEQTCEVQIRVSLILSQLIVVAVCIKQLQVAHQLRIQRGSFGTLAIIVSLSSKADRNNGQRAVRFCHYSMS